MKNINLNGIKSNDPTWNVMSPRDQSANTQEKNDAAIKWSREKQQRRHAGIVAALSKNPKMTHIEDRKIVAKNLWKHS